MTDRPQAKESVKSRLNKELQEKEPEEKDRCQEKYRGDVVPKGDLFSFKHFG